jgi:hypothetical protein
MMEQTEKPFPVVLSCHHFKTQYIITNQVLHLNLHTQCTENLCMNSVVVLLVLLDRPWWDNVHDDGFAIFKPVKQKFLNLEWFSLLEIN